MAGEDQQGRARVLAVALGTRIRAVRRHQNISQQELADRAGIGRESVIAAENGRTNLQFSTLVAIADALGVHAADLVDNRIDELAVIATVVHSRVDDRPVGRDT